MKALGTVLGYVLMLTVLFAVVWIFVKVLEAVFWLLVPIFTAAGVTLLLLFIVLVLTFMCGVMWADR